MINHNVSGYITRKEDFTFCIGAEKAIALMSRQFHKICVLTNQQCVGKSIITEQILLDIHQKMLTEVFAAEGRIDGIFYCPHLAGEGCACRKPGTGMPLAAKKQHPSIIFEQSIMVGDRLTDLQMGRSLGMYCVWIKGPDAYAEKVPEEYFDLCCQSLAELADTLQENQQ